MRTQVSLAATLNRNPDMSKTHSAYGASPVCDTLGDVSNSVHYQLGYTGWFSHKVSGPGTDPPGPPGYNIITLADEAPSLKVSLQAVTGGEIRWDRDTLGDTYWLFNTFHHNGGPYFTYFKRRGKVKVSVSGAVHHRFKRGKMALHANLFRTDNDGSGAQALILPPHRVIGDKSPFTVPPRNDLGRITYPPSDPPFVSGSIDIDLTKEGALSIPDFYVPEELLYCHPIFSLPIAFDISLDPFGGDNFVKDSSWNFHAPSDWKDITKYPAPPPDIPVPMWHSSGKTLIHFGGTADFDWTGDSELNYYGLVLAEFTVTLTRVPPMRALFHWNMEEARMVRFYDASIVDENQGDSLYGNGLPPYGPATKPESAMWEFGDGSSYTVYRSEMGSGYSLSHNYSSPGTYIAKLTTTIWPDTAVFTQKVVVP